MYQNADTAPIADAPGSPGTICVVTYGETGGGLSPVVLISSSVVTVVVPPGVETVVSVFVVALSSAHPRLKTVSRLKASTDVTMRFMFKLLKWK
jgi:hypothetical protein